MSSPNTISFSLYDSMKGSVDYANKRASFDLIMARVSFVLLDDSDKNKFTSLGGWKAIGTIECRPFVNFNNPESDPVIARPLSSNITRYPLVNEIVVLKVYVSKEAQNSFDNYKPEVYYTDIISLFNAPEENAAPDESYLKLNPNEKYVTGKYVPSGEVKRLIKAPGDITIEGRRGNSIRFGSNMEGFRTPWIAKKNNPIFVISNNQAKTADASARFESINDDGSTLIMMSGHNVSFQPASTNFDSYNETVTIPEKNNIVVTDQQPKAQPQESLKQEDQKPIPKDAPKPEPTPVAVAVPPSSQTLSKEDEEEMPEREDLMVLNFQLEVIDVTNNEQPNVPDISSPSKDLLQNNGTLGKNLGNVYYYPCSIFNQGDPIWAKNSSDNLTMKKHGCCYTSFSMLVTSKKSSSFYNPQWFWNNSSKDVMVYWQRMSQSVGLSGFLEKTRSISTVDSVISKGPLMFEWVNSLSSGTNYKNYYTKGKQHWMVISGKNSDGTYTIIDPTGGKIRTNQKKEAIEAGLNRIYYFK